MCKNTCLCGMCSYEWRYLFYKIYGSIITFNKKNLINTNEKIYKKSKLLILNILPPVNIMISILWRYLNWEHQLSVSSSHHLSLCQLRILTLNDCAAANRTFCISLILGIPLLLVLDDIYYRISRIAIVVQFCKHIRTMPFTF